MGKVFFCKVIKTAVLLVLFQQAAVALSVAADLVVEGEIAHLMAFLEQSDCEFNRNGTWYNAAKAVAHIQQKYRYLDKRGLVTSTESFIDRAASKSSMSGKPYLVRCAGGETVESSSWFLSELAKLRQRCQDNCK